MEDVDDIRSQCKRTLIRCDNILWKIFKQMKVEDSQTITAEDCFKITNEMGLKTKEIFFIAASHNYLVDWEGYKKLLNQQEIKMKCIKPNPST